MESLVRSVCRCITPTWLALVVEVDLWWGVDCCAGVFFLVLLSVLMIVVLASCSSVFHTYAIRCVVVFLRCEVWSSFVVGVRLWERHTIVVAVGLADTETV